MRRTVSLTRSTAMPTAFALLLRMGAVMQGTGLARSTIYKLIAEDKFPQPVRLTGRAVAWRRADLEQWSAARPTATH
jgi:prophage regulatory protein